MRKKYKLNIGDNINESLLYWMKLYLKYKCLNLSTRLVFNKTKLQEDINNILDSNSLLELNKIILSFNKNGFNGIAVYFYTLRNLYNFLIINNKLNNLRDIDNELILEFIFINKNTLSAYTLKTYKCVILNFFKYIELNNLDNYYYALEINIKYAKSRFPRFLNKDSISKLINYIEQINITNNTIKINFINFRNKLIAKLIILSGIRSSEVCLLKVNDIKYTK